MLLTKIPPERKARPLVELGWELIRCEDDLLHRANLCSLRFPWECPAQTSSCVHQRRPPCTRNSKPIAIFGASNASLINNNAPEVNQAERINAPIVLPTGNRDSKCAASA